MHTFLSASCGSVKFTMWPCTTLISRISLSVTRKAFKFPGWQDYDYYNERGVLFMVHKSLGTAKQWLNYCDMWDMKDVWSIIDQAKGVTVGAIYAESGRDAVQQYLDKGDNASLITITNNALGRF